MKRLVWIGLMVLAATIAIFAQVDRQSRIDPSLGAFVPAPFRAFAQQSVTIDRMAHSDPAAALREAERLVERRPVPAEHLYLLALAQFRAGEQVKSATTLQAAARRGWRIMPVQQAMAELALQAGDGGEAANRLAAIWALDPDSPALADLTAKAIAAPGGAKAFATALAGTRKWQQAFLTKAPGMLQPQVMARVVRSAAGQDARFSCQSLSDLAQSYLVRGEVAAARGVWSGPCAAAVEPESGFTPVRLGPAGPFAWTYSDRGAVRLDVRRSGQQWVLDFEQREPVTRTLATRWLALAPGAHAVSLASDGGSGEMAVVVTCRGKSGARRQIAALEGEGAVSFVVPGQGCEAQQVSLRAGAGSRVALRISVE